MAQVSSGVGLLVVNKVCLLKYDLQEGYMENYLIILIIGGLALASASYFVFVKIFNRSKTTKTIQRDNVVRGDMAGRDVIKKNSK